MNRNLEGTTQARGCGSGTAGGRCLGLGGLAGGGSRRRARFLPAAPGSSACLGHSPPSPKNSYTNASGALPAAQGGAKSSLSPQTKALQPRPERALYSQSLEPRPSNRP